MIRWSLFVALAVALVAYSFWLYLRVELAVPASRRLAVARALALLVLLGLLFDVRLPAFGAEGGSPRWVLLDASLSMTAGGSDDGTAWEDASSRARELEDEGWTVVTFGDGTARSESADGTVPDRLSSLLAPALDRASEMGARELRVLSDLRFQDAASVRSSRPLLPVELEFERFGEATMNAGIARLEVPDVPQPERGVTAEVEVFGGVPGDSLSVVVMEEGRTVAELRVEAPAEGLRARVPVDLPSPTETGRIRYTASVSLDGDGFESDDEAVTYASIGHEAGALVLVSLRPDWEPRHLLPVLEEVSGLPGLGYLRVGADSFVPMGRAVDRSGPVDSLAVGRVAAEAALLVVHGLGSGADAWSRSLATAPGRKLLFVSDADGAGLVGVPSGEPRDGEWYVSQEVPASPIAGAMTGVTFQGLPPLSDVLLPDDPSQVRGPLLVQLRGAGPLEAALHVEDGPDGRMALALSSGFWRWASRDDGREAYRRLWSGVVGWLLSGQSVARLEARPMQWVVPRGEPVTWSVPEDDLERRLVVSLGDSVVVDTTLAEGGPTTTGVLPPGSYTYTVEGGADETETAGRFDVAEATLEMLPAAEPPQVASEAVDDQEDAAGAGRPLRTRPWPYLLVIALLCGEWIGRRRSGLR